MLPVCRRKGEGLVLVYELHYPQEGKHSTGALQEGTVHRGSREEGEFGATVGR